MKVEKLASAQRNGVVVFSQSLPKGNLPILRHAHVEAIISRIARHGYRDANGDYPLLVSGVPEADNDDEAYKAFMSFRDLARARAAAYEKETVQ